MSLSVKFVNKSGEQVTLYQGRSILKVLEAGKRWDRDPKLGTLSTPVVTGEQKFPPPRPGPKWIDKVEWTYEECPEESIYAPYRTIVFLDGNEVQLKKRPHWKEPEMKWPVVLFLFKSHKIKIYQPHLEGDVISGARTFYNGLPVRITVSPLSRYAPFRKWIFDEVMVLKKEAYPPFKQVIEAYEATEHGEDKRPANELAKIAELKAKDEERKKLKLV